MQQLPSPNFKPGRINGDPYIFIEHYSAGKADEIGLARVFASRARKASSHFGIGRTGGIAQYVNLANTAWHAGDHTKDYKAGSRIPTLAQLLEALATDAAVPFIPLEAVPYKKGYTNDVSIGIEHCNRGWAPRGRNAYAHAVHRAGPYYGGESWESYSDEQIDASQKLHRGLMSTNPRLRFICAHEDVVNHHTLEKAGGKTDVGPLFPWQVFQNLGLIRVMFNFDGRPGWNLCQV